MGLAVELVVVVGCLAAVDFESVGAGGAIKHSDMSEGKALEPRKVFRSDFDAEFLGLRSHLVDKDVVVVCQHPVTDKLWGFPGEFIIRLASFVVNALEILGWFAGKGHGGGDDLVFGRPNGVVLVYHIVSVGSRAGQLVVEELISIQCLVNANAVAVDVEFMVFGRYGPMQLDAVFCGSGCELLWMDEPQ